MSTQQILSPRTPFIESGFAKLVGKYLDFEYVPLDIHWDGQTYAISLYKNTRTGSYQIGAVGYGGIVPFPHEFRTFRQIVDLISKRHGSIAQITLPPIGENVLAWEFADMGFRQEVLETYILDLTAYREQKEMLFKGRVRTDIRFAEKSGVYVKTCDSEQELLQFYDIYKSTMERVQASYVTPYALISELTRHSPDARLYVALNDKHRVIAGSFFLQNEENVFYWINASDSEFRNLRANYLILKQAIDDTYETKSYLNFGYSHNPSIANSKLGWGCQIQKYIRLTKELLK
ncbi:peptidoglycan bridge formation glycyltransferase FemA/FemB family protein [Paenibacillus farraposensis]|uniref:Lipid II:glycine glycyltransferase n=1 Tax=Paenibacillus farraposensis TaxID=2807095 RepID=A0ABW4DKN4_9BACL|nr:GNAT family N-acetyltransferase [Paenibacillus farraposensis]MCC3378205.1 GNAT family N-acetyltransferase [Paenibacillus farraposensis]